MNKLYNLLFLLLCLFYQTQVIGQEQLDGSIMHDGLERTYILYIPASYVASEAVPLVINFHGLTSNAFDQMFYGNFRTIADRENFIVVHPQGTLNADGDTYWNAQFDPDGVDDISFTAALIDSLAASYNINTKRVYSTGMSNGGFMSYTLACELSDKIAAVASVTGSMTTIQTESTCNPENICPVMEIHGTADNVVPYGGGPQFLASTDEVIAHWVNQNGCNTEADLTQIDDSNLNDNSTVERYLYTGCKENSTIELFKVIDGGHTWPGSSIKFGVTNCDINASEEIWRFFSQYNIDGNLSKTSELQTEEVLVFPSVVQNEIQLRFSEAKKRTIKIYNTAGQQVRFHSSQENETTINVSDHPKGTYIAEITSQGLRTLSKFIKV